MKLEKKIILFFTSVLLISTATLLLDSQPGTYGDFKYDQLKRFATEKGLIRVIVKMDVPDIEALTVRSTRYKTGNKDASRIQEAYNADLALDEAISFTRNSILHGLNGSFYRINRTYSTLPYTALSVDEESLDRLRDIPGVLDVVEDKATPLPDTEIQNETEDDISHPMLQRSVEIVGAVEAWGLGYTGAGWYVAILDTGILKSHEMFQGKHIIEQCYALGDEWNDQVNGSCPNGMTEMSGPGSAVHYENRFGHGSHVSGIAAGNNHDDRFGVAKDANIIAVQVFSYFPEEDDVLSWDSDQLKGLEYVYTLRNTYNIASVNLSLGGSERESNLCYQDSRAAAMANLKAVGIASVVSSGNSSYCDAVNAPACIPSAIAVNASDKTDNETYYGNWHNNMVNLIAPGENILSADAQGNSQYRVRSGTSMAAPHVTGAWAILKQFNNNLGCDEVMTLFGVTGKLIYSTRCSSAQPKPRIDIGDALYILLGLAPPANISAEQVTNKAFLRTEYINKITWESNPLNQGKNVSQYRIYIAQNSQLNLLVQVNSSTFEYWHRNVQSGENVTYAITALNAEGQESIPAYFTMETSSAQ